MIERAIQNSLFSNPQDKTFTDKLLGRQDVDAVRELMKKEPLERSEVLDLLYMLSSTESKLFNYSEWDRYVQLKFFTWIRDFVKIAEQVYDYEDDLKKNKVKISARAAQMISNNKRLIEHNVKFLADLYLNIGRTSLSVSGTGFIEILKNKYEISYPNSMASTENNSGRFSLIPGSK